MAPRAGTLAIAIIGTMPSDEKRTPPPRRVQRIGRAINRLVVRHPALWPLARGRVRGFFDQRADTWDQTTSAGSAEHLAALAAALLEIRPPPERALDIGTGTGAGALLVAREFPTCRVRGIDLSERMIAVAQRRVGLDPDGRIAFRVADAAKLPYPDDHFDLITLLNTPPLFREIVRVLRPQGTVVIAASWGAETPFFTPEHLLRRAMAPFGLDVVSFGSAGPGTFATARRP